MFNKLPMTESTSRFTFSAACGLSIFAAGAAIWLRIRNLNEAAFLFLLFALAGCAVAIVAYRRYDRLRRARWKTELKTSEDALNQVLNHARMNVIIEHVTGPLQQEMADPDRQISGLEGQEVAQR
jgi:hypothetical protein